MSNGTPTPQQQQQHGRKIDLMAGIGFIAGGGLMAAFPLLGPKGLAIGGGITAIAGLLRVIFNPTNAPAQAVAAGAPILDKSNTTIATITDPTKGP